MLSSTRWNIPFLFVVLLTSTLLQPLWGDEGSCSTNGEIIDGESSCTQSKEWRQKCDVRPQVITPPASSIYIHGGSAQAYKANQPEKNYICDDPRYFDSKKKARYRVATWPFWRKGGGPLVNITLVLSLWTCGDPDMANTISSSSAAAPTTTASQRKSSWFGKSPDHDKEATICCQALTTSSGAAGTVVEVWQARPDGTYSSLRKGMEDGDCRAKQTIQSSHKTATTFHTIAPGSTGSLGGLGPHRWDFPPYGPPVIHVMVTSPRNKPILFDIPLLLQRKTLQPYKFPWPDWRGASWVHGIKSVDPYRVTSWEVSNNDRGTRTIEISLDVFLQQQQQQQQPNQKSIHELLCRSWIYGFPSSFFLEPISECAPSMMDFFTL